MRRDAYKSKVFDTPTKINNELARLKSATELCLFSRKEWEARADPAKVETRLAEQRKIIDAAQAKMTEIRQHQANAAAEIENLDRQVRLYERQAAELRAAPRIDKQKAKLKDIAAKLQETAEELRAAGIDVDALLAGALGGKRK